jgi:hypothetical protein
MADTEIKYNGWLFRGARHFWCGMVNGHEWKNTSPELYGIGLVCQKCIKCGKERVV